MGKILARINLKREPGKLYYIKSDEEGYLLICEADLARGGKKKKKKKLKGGLKNDTDKNY
jgi:hypothetical protein